MALIIISGHPSSGKTYRTSQLHAALSKLLAESTHTEQSLADLRSLSKQPPTNLQIPTPISEHTLNLARSLYSTGSTEKTLRAALYSTVKRMLGRNNIVLLDSGNYIKGWRYQLHCEARAVGVRSCVVHVGVSEEKARAVNEARLARLDQAESGSELAAGGASSPKSEVNAGKDVREAIEALALAGSSTIPMPSAGDNITAVEQSDLILDGPALADPYNPTLHADLCARYEEPNAAARWDSPLYTVLWDDAAPPAERIWREVVLGIKADGKSMGKVRMNAATVLTPPTPPSYLHTLDRTTQSILSQIMRYNSAHADEPGGTLGITSPESISSFSSTTSHSLSSMKQLHLPPNPLTVPYLQRLRRQFIQLQRQQVGGQGMGAIGGGVDRGEINARSVDERVAWSFVDWLNDRFGGEGVG